MTRQIVVISDLHLGEGKNPKTKHWERIEDFRWPDQFNKFLSQIDEEGKGKTDLIVAGDLFELWQSRINDCSNNREKDFGCTEKEALSRLQRVISAHRYELRALGKFAKKADNRLIIIPGNHDVALLFPSVRDAAIRAIGGGKRVQFMPSGYWVSEDNLIYIEHGHQIGREVNKWYTWPSPFSEKNGKRYLQRPWGEKFVQDYYNRYETKYPIIDNISSEGEGVRYAMAADGPHRTIADIAGFMNFYVFGVSWTQFKSSLGKEKAGEPPEWDIEAIREQGPCFLSGSIPDDHPFYSDIRDCSKRREPEQLVELFEKLSDEDIKSICDQRAYLAELQQDEIKNRKRDRTSISECPRKAGSLGAVAQSIFLSGKKVLGDHLENVVCPTLKGCQENPFMVFIYGHTHLSLQPMELSLSRGYWKPTILNSGAWQRVATPDEISLIRQKKNLPKEAVLTGLFPEDLPPCYSFVLVKPYEKGKMPRALLRYWVGEEGKIGQVKEGCGL
ncbi:MAG TPA: hypothetical protein HA232_00485 [Methanocellales archaeon]|nr:hypothetical protein [Methanocellales archaeon]